ncbi:MAG TPA: hypothetical protein VIM98_18220 [Dyella sp.]|uniref:hypothetical protein n=1 Tax=Dyella sp. TaxID=1869338 RepID=UPI002F93CB6D
MSAQGYLRAQLGPFVFFMATVTTVGGLPAVAVARSASTSDKETYVMTQGIEPAQSSITAQQALQRLLDMLRQSKSIEDFTPEFIGHGMGVKVTAVDGETYGYGARLSKTWGWGISRENSSVTGPRIDFGFSSLPGSDAPATEVCQLDYDTFTAELEAMGFARKPSYGKQGLILQENFDRPHLHIEVLSQAEHSHTQDGVENRACVKSVIIR